MVKAISDEALDGNEESAIVPKEIILDIEDKSLVFCSNRKHSCNCVYVLDICER